MAGVEKGAERREVIRCRRRRRFLQLNVDVFGPSTSVSGRRRLSDALGASDGSLTGIASIAACVGAESAQAGFGICGALLVALSTEDDACVDKSSLEDDADMDFTGGSIGEVGPKPLNVPCNCSFPDLDISESRSFSPGIEDTVSIALSRLTGSSRLNRMS